MLRPISRLLLICALLVVALPLQASALAQLDFVSSEGRFALDDGRVDFGNGLNISIASGDSGSPDTGVVGFDVILSDLVLTGTVTEIAPGSGVFAAAIDTTVDYTLTIVNPASGFEVLEASYDPGSFLLIGTSGIISPAVEIGVFDVTLSNGGDAFPSLAALLAADQDPGGGIDLNIVLSSAGGPELVTALLEDRRVEGAVAGTLAVIPEPGTALLALSGLAGLSVWGRRQD